MTNTAPIEEDERNDLKRGWDYLLKRVWHEIFSFKVFFMNQLPTWDNGDKHSFANIFEEKKSNNPNGILWDRGHWFMEKPEVKNLVLDSL